MDIKKLSKIGYYVFIVTIAIVGGFFVLLIFPISDNYQVKIVQSGSMEPAIRTGALVIVKPADRYRLGDIIMFGEDTKTKVPTTHRIVADEVREGVYYYTTKGDANEDPDTQLVAQSEVIGKVLFSIPYLGYILDFAKKPVGFALLIGVPAVVVISDEVANIWRETRILRVKNRKGKDENEDEKNHI